MRGLPLILAAGLACVLAGVGLGLIVGEGIALVGLRIGLPFTAIYAGSFLIVGGLVAWFGLPLENRCIWLPLIAPAIDLSSVDGQRMLFRVAPLSFFFVVALLIGISHRQDAPVIHALRALIASFA